jgi:hypothetical protein
MQPFAALWKLITGILGLTGRLVAGIIGTLFIVLGAVLCMTVIGAIVGVPLIIIGVLLVIRCLF